MSGCLSISAAQPVHAGARRRLSAFRTRPSFSTLIVASAAAQLTGLPPNVLACAPGGQVITSARARVTPSGRPDAMPFAIVTMSASRPKCSHANILPVRPMPDCTSSAISSMPCLRRQLAQPLMKLRRRHDVAALALDRLDEHGGDLVGRDEVHEDLILDEVEALRRRTSPASGRPDSGSSSRTARGYTPGIIGPKPRRWTYLLDVAASAPSVRP